MKPRAKRPGATPWHSGCASWLGLERARTSTSRSPLGARHLHRRSVAHMAAAHGPSGARQRHVRHTYTAPAAARARERVTPSARALPCSARNAAARAAARTPPLGATRPSSVQRRVSAPARDVARATSHTHCQLAHACARNGALRVGQTVRRPLPVGTTSSAPRPSWAWRAASSARVRRRADYGPFECLPVRCARRCCAGGRAATTARGITFKQHRRSGGGSAVGCQAKSAYRLQAFLKPVQRALAPKQRQTTRHCHGSGYHATAR